MQVGGYIKWLLDTQRVRTATVVSLPVLLRVSTMSGSTWFAVWVVCCATLITGLPTVTDDTNEFALVKNQSFALIFNLLLFYSVSHCFVCLFVCLFYCEFVCLFYCVFVCLFALPKKQFFFMGIGFILCLLGGYFAFSFVQYFLAYFLYCLDLIKKDV